MKNLKSRYAEQRLECARTLKSILSVAIKEGWTFPEGNVKIGVNNAYREAIDSFREARLYGRALKTIDEVKQDEHTRYGPAYLKDKRSDISTERAIAVGRYLEQRAQRTYQ